MKDFVKPDFLVNANISGETYALTPKYDSIHTWPKIGAWMLKVFTDDGFASFALNESDARKISEGALLPIVERDFMVESEHKHWLKFAALNLKDDMFDLGFDDEQIVNEHMQRIIDETEE